MVALDVAYGELHWSLRQDPRVTVIERRNARHLEPDELPFAPDLIVADVAFISLTKVLPAVLRCAAPRFDCLALVKPQFEVGRERVGKGGVVRSPDDRRAALVAVAADARERAGAAVLGFASSGLPGPAGQPRELRVAGRGAAAPARWTTSMRRRARWSREAARRSPSSATAAPGTPAARCGGSPSLRARRASRCGCRRPRSRSTGSCRARSRAGPEGPGSRHRPRASCSAATAPSSPTCAGSRARGVPVFAVNFGAIGFLATVEPWELDEGCRSGRSPASSTRWSCPGS